MGMIMTRYNMLAKLRKETSEGNVKKFELTALVVHDINDIAFKHLIEESFYRFCSLTGEKFLFITYIVPNEKKKTKYNEQYIFKPEGLFFDKNCDEEIEKDVIPLIRKNFNIPDNGSYLVLFDDFGNTKNNSYALIKTDKNTFLNQLNLITDYCETDNSKKNYSNLIQELGGDLRNPEINFYSFILGLASLTSEFDSFFEHINNQQKEANIFIQNFRDYIQKRIAEATEEIMDENSQSLLQLYNLLSKGNIINSSNRQHRRKSHTNRHNPGYGFNPGFDDLPSCDYNPNRFYKLIITLEDILNDHNSEFSHLSKSYFDNLINLLYAFDNQYNTDYSCFILYCAKIIEQELNLSLGQLIRKELGIPMPNCYNRVYYFLNQSFFVFTNYKDVDFNRPLIQGKFELQYVPIGDLYYSLMSMNSFNDNFRPIDPRQLEVFKNFKNYRNKCCHSHPIKKYDFEEAMGLFIEFCDTLLPLLCDIKRSLCNNY